MQPTDGATQLNTLLERREGLLALAPMQDVTDLAFMRVIAEFGAPDYFFTEFFRVHGQSRPEKHILRSRDRKQSVGKSFLSVLQCLRRPK